MTGYLQQNPVTEKFTFVVGDYAGYDTQATGTTATQNVMTIGGQGLTSPALASGCGGLHVVLTDGNLGLQANQSFTTQCNGNPQRDGSYDAVAAAPAGHQRLPGEPGRIARLPPDHRHPVHQ